MKTILVTGGTGFIGSHVVEELLKQGYNVTVLDNLSKGMNIPNKCFNSGRLFLKQGDMNNYKDLKEVLNISDAIIHLGALVSVQESMKHPYKYHENNVLATEKILTLAPNYGIKKIIIASSCAYENPKSPYAYTKLINVIQAEMYREIYGLDVIPLTFYNVYGERQRIDGEGAVIPSFITKLLKNEQPTIYGDGKQKRDFIYVKDVAKMTVECLKKPYISPSYCQVGTGIATPINFLYKLIAGEIGSNLKPIYKENRKGEVRINMPLVVNTKLTQLKEGLKRTIEWYKKEEKNK